MNKFKVAEIEISYKTNVLPEDRVVISQSQDCYNVFKSIYDVNKIEYQEMFYVMLLNKANHVLGVNLVSSGSVDGTIVDVKKCFQAAIVANASSMIVSHNHPSGRLVPSESDIKLTKQIKEGGKILNIQLLDHIIISLTNNYYSFADEGLL